MTGTNVPPVLVLAFNRPDRLQVSLNSLMNSDPSRVYVNVDGPREGIPADVEGVAECIRVARAVTTGAELHLRTHDVNKGLGDGARSAISWFFDNEERGMILEDDIVISPHSLNLAGALLDEFSDAETVGSISLFSAVPQRLIQDARATYRHSRMPPSWFWGSWRNRWDQLITDFRAWRDLFSESYLAEVGGSRFSSLYTGFCDADVGVEDVNWEGAWIGTHFAHKWTCVVTNHTYCIHTGYSDTATHLSEQPSWQPVSFEAWDGILEHPASQTVDRKADHWALNQRFVLSRVKRTKVWLGRKLPLLRRVWRRYSVKTLVSTSD